MEELLNQVLQPSTLISLITSLAAFYSSYKLLEQRVSTLEKKDNETHAILTSIQEKLSEIQISQSEIQINIKWLMKNDDKLEQQKK